MSTSATNFSEDTEISDPIDISTVLEVVRAITDEREWDRLLPRIIQVVLAYSDARRSALVLHEGGQWVVAGDGFQVHQDDVALLSRPLHEANLPVTAVTEVLHTRKVLVSSHMRVAAQNNPHAEQAFVLICLPLLHHERLLGALYLEYARLATLDNENLEMLRFIASQVATALHHAWHYRQLEQQLAAQSDELARVRSALHDANMQRFQARESSRAALLLASAHTVELTRMKRIAEQLNQAVTPAAAIKSGLETLAALVAARIGWVWAVSPTGMVNLLAVYNPPPELAAHPDVETCWPSCECLQRLQANELTEPMHMLPCQRLTSLRQSDEETVWHVSVPIRAGGHPVGIVNLVVPQDRHFNESDMRMFAAVRDQFGVALERARLFRQIAETLQREQRLNDVTRAISSTLDMQVVMPTIVRLATELVGADAGGVWMLTTDKTQMVAPYSYNLPLSDELQQFCPTLQHGMGLFWQVVEQGESVLTNDYVAHPQSLPEFVQAGIQAALMVPIIAGKQILGVLCLYSLSTLKTFDERDQALVESVGQQAGVAIQNARLFTAVQHRAQELDALRATMTEISGELDLDRLLKAILERAAALLEASSGELSLYDEDRNDLHVLVSFNMDQDYTGTRLSLGEGASGYVALTREPLIVGDYQAWPGRSARYATAGSQSVLAVPLLARGNLVGSISIGRKLDTAQPFDETDVERLSLFAQQATIAIQNARLFAEVQHLATTDPLTGLYNRRHFFYLADRVFERVQQAEQSLVAVMLDVDHFKRVNDTYGHTLGDHVLRVIAERCRETLRPTDLIGRYGGEEIVILLSDTALSEALSIAERLRHHIGDVPIQSESGAVQLTVSLGVALWLPGDRFELHTLIDRADQALYTAKHSGRNCVVGWQA